MGRALGCGARSRARKFEATTYLKTEHPEEIPALVRDLDAKAYGLARGWEGLREAGAGWLRSPRSL